MGLGAIQVAEESGLIRRIDYLSAVSGGSYTATAVAAARARMQDPTRSRPPWSRGSPEEDHLRRSLRYLGEDWSDVVVGIVQYLVGLLLNLLPFLATLVVVSSAVGLFYRTTGVLVLDGSQLVAGHTGIRIMAALGVAVSTALLDRRAVPWMSAPLRFASMSAVILLLFPDIAEVAAEIAAATTRLTLQPVALGIVAGLAMLVVMRSQWAVQIGLLRSIGVRAARAFFLVTWFCLLVATFTLGLRWSISLPTSQLVLYVGAAAALLIVFGFFVHANMSSLHDVYSNRLNRAFVVISPERDDGRATRLADVSISALNAPDWPELLVCAAVNLADSESAEGEGCGSFVFSYRAVGGPRVGRCTTQDYLDRLLTGYLSCASVVAASGAAIAPNMGVFTRRSLRFFLALANLRLGMWLPNPAREHDPDRSILRRGWHEPGPLATWREALGGLSRRHRFVFVSDGGHWDNSGIVELLRRHCRVIFAVDAATDEFRLSNVLRMMSLARVECGVDFQADAGLLSSAEPILTIPFAYALAGEREFDNYLILMRTHISEDMPADLYALAESLSPFPRHSTVNQFLRAKDVDAYIALGRWLFARAHEAADLPPDVAPAAASMVAPFDGSHTHRR